MLTLKNWKKKLVLLVIAILSLLLITLFILSSEMSMDGEKHLRIVDRNGRDLTAVVIIPLYSKTYRIGFGPDGKGFSGPESLLITKPFIINSGEDIMINKIPSRGIIIAPFSDKSGVIAGFFRSNNFWSFAVIKKGYAPVVIKGDDMYGIKSIVMTNADNNQNADVINTLVATPTNQDALRRIFRAGPIRDKIDVSLAGTDIALLKSTVD
jgi:hypothetical protein